jgi:DNA invertase Pin-like site-specific DNA recombinase
MQRTYRASLARVGWMALLAVLVLLALPGTSPAASNATGATIGTGEVPLARGAGYTDSHTADRVRDLQLRLRRLGKRPGPIDGLFGPLTEGAVQRFQRVQGLADDGIVGPRTTRALKTSEPTRVARRTHTKRVRQRQLIRRIVRSSFERLLKVGLRPETVKGAPVAPPARPPVGLRPGVQGAAGTSGTAEPMAPTPPLLIATALMATLLALSLAPRFRGWGQGRTAAGPRQPALSAAATGAAVTNAVAQRTNGAGHRTNGAAPATTAPGRSKAPAPPAERLAAPPLPVKAIGYASIPESDDLDRDLLQRQALGIEKLCDARGWTLVDLVREVEGTGGKSRARPGLRYALELMGSDEVSCLVVSQLRRLSGTAAELGAVLTAIAKSGGRLVALDVDIDTATPEGGKAANLLIKLAAWERERAVERTKKGLQAARARGVSIGRPAVGDVPELKRWIRAMRTEGLTLQAIADRLNEERVPTLRGGKEWRPSSVQAAAGYRRPPQSWAGRRS